MKLLKVYAADNADREAQRQAALEEYNQQMAQVQTERDAYEMQERIVEGSIINAVKDGLGQYADGLRVSVDWSYRTKGIPTRSILIMEMIRIKRGKPYLGGLTWN